MITEQKSLLPGLSAAWLKYFACLLMVVDHVAVVFVRPSSPYYDLLRCIGRIVFPVFAFLVAESCRYTKRFPRYLLRLFTFALLSQVPYVLVFRRLDSASVIMTFFLAASSIYLFEKGKQSGLHYWGVLLLFPLAWIGHIIDTDYGAYGILMVFLLYVVAPYRRLRLVCFAAAAYLIQPVQTYFASLPMSSVLTSFRYAFWFSLCAASAVIPLAFYNGERGRGSKWFFYIFYPAHLLVLWAVKCLVG